MSFSPIPTYAFKSVTEISGDFLKSVGVSFLMLDLDNTLAKYSVPGPAEDIASWVSGLMGSGTELCIVSNNKRRGRVEAFAAVLGVRYVKGAGKPGASGVLRAMREAGYTRERSALVGDQVFTDTIAASIAGVKSIIVRPLNLKNPVFAVRYGLEAPFRFVCKNKMWGKRG